MSVAISVRDLIFEYTRSDEQSGEEKIFRAIDGVSSDIEDGSFVAIVGRNGSRTSTRQESERSSGADIGHGDRV